MYLRFTLLARDPDSGRKQGLLVAAHEFCEERVLSVAEHRALRHALDWFNVNLHVPTCLDEPANRRALSWFKPQATKPLAHMWRLVALLSLHDIQTQLHKVRNPGLILYEDGWQVVAKPRRGARAGW
jgi:hypothetical protein